jgi:glycosyltransferase involved in cell wall biosynthesis
VHGEGIPNVVMEYMALKKPVIVTDCGGTKELVENNHTGFLVEAEKKSNSHLQIKYYCCLTMMGKALALKLGLSGYNKLVKRIQFLDVMGKEILCGEKLYRKLDETLCTLASFSP